MISRERIVAMEALIRPHVRRTPVIEAEGMVFKLESLQHSGSFKVRGAFANLLTRKVPAAGVVAASGGNHGAAVAYAARALEMRAHIYVPSVCSPAKISRIKSYGAELVVEGERYADALAASERWAAQSGALQVHAYDQEGALLGQGTVGLELDQQATIDTLIVAVGGGGLIGGIAAWYEGRVRIVGVEPRLAPTLTRALAAGRPVDAEAGGIAADSLAPRRVGELMYPIAKRFVERVVLVDDDAIHEAQVRLWDSLRVVAEPGGAAAYAAILLLVPIVPRKASASAYWFAAVTPRRWISAPRRKELLKRGRSPEAFAAAALLHRVRVVEAQAPRQPFLDQPHRRALDVRQARRVDRDAHAAAVERRRRPRVRRRAERCDGAGRSSRRARPRGAPALLDCFASCTARNCAASAVS